MAACARRPLPALIATLTVVLAVFAPWSAPFSVAQTSTVRINEVESNGGTPGDWVELINTGATPVDLSGYLFRDNDNSRAYTLAPGSIIAAGGYLVLDEVVGGVGQFTFGLGSSDSARLFAPDGVTLIDSYTWTAHAATTYGRCPNGVGAFAITASSTKGTANDCGGAPTTAVKINEIESNGGTPGDWVELVNTSGATVDLAGYVLKDNNNANVFTLPIGATVAAGGFLVLNQLILGVGDFPFDLDNADSVRLFAPNGVTLIDSFTWTAHAVTTYGRCPAGTGPFITTSAPTKGAANSCQNGLTAVPWPGDAGTAVADAPNQLGGNLSGLVYEPSGTGVPGALWAVQNGPGTLYKLIKSGGVWTPDPAFAASGKPLRYLNGAGDPDAEGVTFTDAGPQGGVYVATERNNASNGVSRPSILLYYPFAPGATLSALREWSLTADLPPLGPNLGLEGITWVPDTFLVARGFFDERQGRAYRPDDYPHHGAGLFFVGVEGNGLVYAYALNHADSSVSRVATIITGFPAVMDLSFDRELATFWVMCDDTCNGRGAHLTIDGAGRFVVTRVFERPAGLANLNNEGFAVAAQAECVTGRKPAFWADDNNTGGNALRQGTVDCGDSDGDGFSDLQETGSAGTPAGNRVGSDPHNPASKPEVCNGVDDDLNEGSDEGYPDSDRDGIADCVDREPNRPARPLPYRVLGTFPVPAGGAEVVAAAPDGRHVAVTTSAVKQVAVLDLANPAAPTQTCALDTAADGEPTSVAIHPSGAYALTVVKNDPRPGVAIAFALSGCGELWRKPVGIGPDSIVISRDGKRAVIAVEDEETAVGDPTTAAGCQPTNSRPGRVDIIDLTNPARTVTPVPIDLTLVAGVNCASDPQPEGIVITPDSLVAYVTLQENNALATIDLSAARVLHVLPLATTNHLADTTQDGIASITNAFTGRREPDGIALSSDGNFLFTADEGDSARTGSGAATVFSGGRTMTVLRAARYARLGGDDGGGAGAGVRLLSPPAILTDTAAQIEAAAAANGALADGRTRNRGPEPEGITTFRVNGLAGSEWTAVTLERSNALMLFDISTRAVPTTAAFIPTGAAPETVVALPGRNLLVTANEGGASLTIICVRPDLGRCEPLR